MKRVRIDKEETKRLRTLERKPRKSKGGWIDVLLIPFLSPIGIAALIILIHRLLTICSTL
jgi:hypothetical protein